MKKTENVDGKLESVGCFMTKIQYSLDMQTNMSPYLSTMHFRHNGTASLTLSVLN
jgi:hypothetical protein